MTFKVWRRDPRGPGSIHLSYHLEQGANCVSVVQVICDRSGLFLFTFPADAGTPARCSYLEMLLSSGPCSWSSRLLCFKRLPSPQLPATESAGGDSCCRVSTDRGCAPTIPASTWPCVGHEGQRLGHRQTYCLAGVCSVRAISLLVINLKKWEIVVNLYRQGAANSMLVAAAWIRSGLGSAGVLIWPRGPAWGDILLFWTLTIKSMYVS